MRLGLIINISISLTIALIFTHLKLVKSKKISNYFTNKNITTSNMHDEQDSDKNSVLDILNRVNNKLTSVKPKKGRKKKKGKVFTNSDEEALHLKLTEDMLFKPLEQENGSFIEMSDSSEITKDDMKQAMEGKEGRCVALPLERKKDAYKEFIRWVHQQEKDERRQEIERNVVQRRRAKLAMIHANHKDLMNGTMSKQRNIHFVNSTRSGIHMNTGNAKHNHPQAIKTSKPTTKKPKKKIVREEIIEFQYDPNYVHNVHNQRIKQRDKKKKQVKEDLQKIDSNSDMNPDDYSDQEEFMVQTRKEAMGRRFYQAFVNKTASDFWDNSTRETTKMLEVLIPLGHHLHNSLDKLPPNEGIHFISDLQVYKRELEKFIALVKKDKPGTYQDVKQLLEEPYDHVCETRFNEDELRIMFGWDVKEYGRFEKVFHETREMWFDLQLFHHCLQFASESSEMSMSTLCNYTDAQIQQIIDLNTFSQNTTGP